MGEPCVATIILDPPARVTACYRLGMFSHTETVHSDGSVTWDFRDPEAIDWPKCEVTLIDG